MDGQMNGDGQMDGRINGEGQMDGLMSKWADYHHLHHYLVL